MFENLNLITEKHKTGSKSYCDNLIIYQLRPEELDGELMGKCAELYCRIWQEPPWFEVWNKQRVIIDLIAQMNKPEAVGLLAVKSSEVIGFTWGYSISKYDLRDISRVNSMDSLFFQKKRLYYIDELAVDLKFRKNGIGSLISRKLLDVISQKQCSAVLLRTDIHAEPARKLYCKLGFKELPITDGTYADRTYWQMELK